MNAKRFDEGAKLLRGVQANIESAPDSVPADLREQVTYRLAVCEFELDRYLEAAKLSVLQQLLARPVDDGSHGLLHGPVLHVDPRYARERVVLLTLEINQVVVASVGHGAEGLVVDVHGTVAEAHLASLLVRQRR